MVDIPNHEDSLRELSKTSLVNNVTLILCWSAAEAGRYLELYKSYENASSAAIRGQQASTYADKLVDFVTVPRSLNKSDAVALVANFGSLKNAINADTEQLGMIGGWGGVKVKRWAYAIEEPFRAKKAAKRGLQAAEPGAAATTTSNDGQLAADRTSRLAQAVPLSRVPLRDMPAVSAASGASSARATPRNDTPSQSTPKQFQFLDDDDDDDSEGLADNDAEEAMLAAAIEASKKVSQQPQRGNAQVTGHPAGENQDSLGGGVAAALAKLRENGG